VGLTSLDTFLWSMRLTLLQPGGERHDGYQNSCAARGIDGLFAGTAVAVNIQAVPVGNPGNAEK
jgi:hypothetical protein